jgi:hypothetical protein
MKQLHENPQTLRHLFEPLYTFQKLFPTFRQIEIIIAGESGWTYKVSRLDMVMEMINEVIIVLEFW